VGQDSAILREQLRLGGNDLAALGYNAAFGAHATGFERDRSGKIHFGFDGGVGSARRKQGMRGASGGAVDQGERPTAVDGAHRIEQVGAGVAFKDGEAVADLD